VYAAPSPRITGGAIASIVFHAGIVAAFFLLRPGAEPPSPPVYRVRLFSAASASALATGVVQQPTAAPVEAAAPVPKAAPARPKVPVPKARSAPAQKNATETPATKSAPSPPANVPAPTASGTDPNGRGADVTNVDTHGIDFPYPAYTKNIVNVLLRFFGPSNMRLTAEVRFMIRRDGSVSGIQLVTPSKVYSFYQKAIGAVDAAANAKAFGPLPDGFREDILPVTFRFSPTLIK
jgi:protein TonB